jgi:type VI protein secretion system component VasK
MRWFFVTFYTATAILVLCFVAWIATRVMHADQANYIVGRIMIYDLYAIGVIAAYTAFVGAWHTWEKLTGRMEQEAEQRAKDAGTG